MHIRTLHISNPGQDSKTPCGLFPYKDIIGSGDKAIVWNVTDFLPENLDELGDAKYNRVKYVRCETCVNWFNFILLSKLF